MKMNMDTDKIMAADMDMEMDTPMHKEIDLNMGIRRGYGQGYRTVQL
jgi:hypothetical protein